MTSKTIIKRFRLENELGLHLRPITVLVGALKPLNAEVIVWKENAQANGKSPLELLVLGAGPQEELEFHFLGPDALQAMTAVEKLFQDKFGEG